MPVGPVLHAGGKRWASNPLKGFPDIMGVFTRRELGRAWAIELKSAKGRLRPEQKAWIARLEKAGVAVAVVRDLESLTKFLREHGEI